MQARFEAQAEAEASAQELADIIKIISDSLVLFVIKGIYYLVDLSFEALLGSTVFEKFINSLIQVGTPPFDASRHLTIPIGDEKSIEQFARGPGLRKRLEREVQINETSKKWTLCSLSFQTSGSMQGPDGASSINQYSFIPSKFLEFNADGVVVFKFDENAPDKQTNTWECLNWKKFTEEQRDRALMLYLSTCTECWHTKHFGFVIDEAKALTFKSLDEAVDYKEIMGILHVLARDLDGAAQQEQNRILTWFLEIWEELEAKHLHELTTIYATMEDEFRLSQDFRRILAGKARILREINVFRQLSLEDVVFLLFIIKIRRIRALGIGKALAEKKMVEENFAKEMIVEEIIKEIMTAEIMAEEITELEMEEYALGKEGEAKEMPKFREKREAKDQKRQIREEYARRKATEARSKEADEFVENEVRPESESERVRLRRDYDIVDDLQEGGYGMLASWVMTRDFAIGDLLYEVYQHMKANLQSNIDESHPDFQAKSLQKQEKSAVDMNDDEEP
ncbi:10c5b7a0-e7bd-4821-bbbd-7738b7831a47 [Sclerotinia trifoliorum]|uniref:10c5b7a0-e7bd-4821-bbbd-7738b7831a47 n=1 Tax=Sclerotinia trifoliorum TaxID=28548 RepID=A0A8H2ZKD6_9HELO|nr:10c5b7a0-e7bd-4821-bbbd-7738b7831a47 [Sclerotinia trifoliorum]